MAYIDLPLDELRRYDAGSTAPADFDEFWRDTLAEQERWPVAATFTRVDADLYSLIEVYDVTFAGYGGEPVRGWLLLPAGGDGPLPCLVSYIGYGGGRSFPSDHLAPAAAGLAHFVMDTRGQGAAWAVGHTPDPHGSDSQHPGFMTKGITRRETYYYRRVFVDGVRAVAAAASHPRVDPRRIGVRGGSQGGGITLAVAGLLRAQVKLALPDVPFLCHFRRATTLTDALPYQEIVNYLKVHRDRVEQTFATLAYFDGVHFAPRITARCLFSVALMDLTCPPSTVFAAYNRVTAPKDIAVYEFNNHEGGGPYQLAAHLRLARTFL